MTPAPRADFGNWIRRRIVVRYLLVGVALAAAGFAAADPLWRGLAWAAAAFPLLLGLYLLHLYVRFSDFGGGVQRALWDRVVGQLDWDGKGRALDVGTGQGALAIAMAEKYPQAEILGVDLWAADWEYSKSACERNARRRGVADRVRFALASASQLACPDATFDAVVSHFVFHEVEGGAPQAVREALRVLKTGGAFCFQDMFFDPKFYGDAEAFARTVRGWGVADVHLVKLSARMAIPHLMRGRRVLGAAGLLYGRK